MLLLLDNLEQVIEAAPALSGLVQACPNLTLFCTSRELLRVQGEVEYSVPPLASSEAVDLFCERSGLEPSDEIAELCARLDDLPLAVELAAARTKALSPAQILERLSDRLDLLRGGRDAEARQQTLRATIALELRPSRQPRSSVSSERSPSSWVAARWTRPRRSPKPTSTRCSRSSRRASYASRTSATGCWRRSASSRSESSSRPAKPMTRQAPHRVLPRSGRGAAGSGWTTDLRRATRALHRRIRRTSGKHTRARWRPETERALSSSSAAWSCHLGRGLAVRTGTPERSRASPCPERRRRIVHMRLSERPSAGSYGELDRARQLLSEAEPLFDGSATNGVLPTHLYGDPIERRPANTALSAALLERVVAIGEAIGRRRHPLGESWLFNPPLYPRRRWTETARRRSGRTLAEASCEYEAGLGLVVSGTSHSVGACGFAVRPRRVPGEHRNRPTLAT